MTKQDPRIDRLLELARAAAAAPRGARRRALAVLMGVSCHLVFAAAISSMMVGMYFGLTKGVGEVSYPWMMLCNLLLILQFPLAHSLLLTRSGMVLLTRLVPGKHGRTLSTTSYAIVASLQLLALFCLWTPSGIVWWRAEGSALYALTVAYLLAWTMLAKAIFDAGADLQSGALGWLSLLADRRPRYPDLPTLGLFRRVRQPIYLAFACTLWTVPTWTPDQLALAFLWTGYCILAPLLKERRFHAQYGERFRRYRQRVPYMIPRYSKESHRDVYTAE